MGWFDRKENGHAYSLPLTAINTAATRTSDGKVVYVTCNCPLKTSEGCIHAGPRITHNAGKARDQECTAPASMVGAIPKGTVRLCGRP